MLQPEVRRLIEALSKQLAVYILTADTYGNVAEQCAGLPAKIVTFVNDHAASHKERFVASLSDGVCAVGNGFNDVAMLSAAALSIAILGEEGVCAQLLLAADVAVNCPSDALKLLLYPNRLRATLRG